MRSAQVIRVLAWVALGMFCITLALSFFVPVYTDEISIKIARSSALFDGLILSSLYPQCGASFALSIPLTWTPGALIYGLAYGNVAEPMYLRISGVSMFVLWLGMLAWIIRRNLGEDIRPLPISAGLVSLVSIGVLPFLLVLSRPEQALFVGITFICILPMAVAKGRPKSHWGWALLSMLFLLAVSFIFYSHPKTSFLIPLMAVSALYLAMLSRRVWVGAILLGGLGWTSYESLSFLTGRLHCSDAPFLDEILKSHFLSTNLLGTSPVDFFHRGLDNLHESKKYVENVLFHARYQSDWLPFTDESRLDVLSAMLNVGISVIYVALAGYILVLLAERLRADWHDGKLAVQTTVPVALLAGIVATSFFMASKNFYESSLVVPLFLLLFALLLPSIPNSVRWRRLHSYMFAFLLVVSILSQMNLIRVFATYVPNQWGEGGQVAGQWLSVSTSDFAQVRKEVVEAAARCGIKPGEANPHLVIDDITYFVFHDAYRPFHALYIGPGWGRDIGGDTNYLPFLNKNNSAGVIARCERLPPESRRLSTESGDYCCISQQDIKRLSEQMTSP
jgi:hypothetical protein